MTEKQAIDILNHYQQVIKNSKPSKLKSTIQEKLIEIDNYRNIKREFLNENISPIVKERLVNGAENKIKALKGEISEILNSY